MRSILLSVLLVAGLTAGCSSEENDMSDATIEEVAAESKQHIDDLAALLGTDPQVQQETITDCVPGQRDSGKEALYTVQVSVEPGTLERVRREVVPAYEAEGWTFVERPDGESIDFTRGRHRVGASVWEDRGVAAVTGSGGCVETD